MQRGKRTHSPLTTRTSSSSKHSPSSPSPSKKLRSAGQIAGYTSTTTPSSSSTIPSTTIAPSSTMLGESRFPATHPQPAPTPFSLPPHHHHHHHHHLPHYVKTTNMDDNDRSSVSDNDSIHSPPPQQQQQQQVGLGTAPGVAPGTVSGAGLRHKVSVVADEKPKPAPGKKTRGRVKIEMQYIQNKLRRYTTFSKRKSGIMKKAYELSTLTGTQVMLLVASETGHVYTFATPKLQPMITSEAGKALIQTCLHTPDPPQQSMDYDIRMSATGYEETELGYGLSDEEAFKTGLEGAGPHPGPQVLTSGSVVIPPGMMQMPFAQVAHPDHHQAMNPVMPPPSAYPMAVSTGPTMSPHSHSPPPSYSPSAHTTTSPRNYPGSPSGISYSQSSHVPPPQHMMMEDLVTGGSPLRKSPDSHYLSHHQFDQSPTHSPMTSVHFPMRTQSPSHQIYAHPGSSPPQMNNHSPIRPM